MPPQQPVSVPRPNFFDTASVWALLLTLAATLLVFVPSWSVSLVTTKTFLLAAGTIVTLAFYILARLGKGTIVFPPVLLIGALWLPVVAYALSAAFSSVSFTNAFWGTGLQADTLGLMLVVVCLGTLSALVLRRPEHYYSFLRAGAYAFGIVALLQAVIILIGRFYPNPILPVFAIPGSFEDLASFLGLGIVALLITLRFFEISRRTRLLLIVSASIALLLLAMANSSLVWTLLALVSLGFFVEAVMRRGGKAADPDFQESVAMDEAPLKTEEGKHSLVLPFIVLAVAIFFLIGGTFGNVLAQFLHVNVLTVRPSWQSTLSVAHKTYATASNFGSGPSTFGSEWLKYRDASLNSSLFWNFDFSSGVGFIPTSFVTTGIVGGIAWAVFLLLFVALGLRTLIARAPQSGFIRFVAILSFIGSLYLFAIAIFNLPSPLILALMFVFVGLFISTTRFALKSQQWGIMFSRSPRLGFIIVFSLTIVLCASAFASYTLVERYVATAQLAHAAAALGAGSLDKAEQAVQDSISTAPSAAAYQLQATIANARLGLIASSSTMPKALAQQAYQKALSSGISAAATATSLDPANYQNWIALGNLYAQVVPVGVTGAYANAKDAYEKAQALNPTNPQILYVLAQLDIAHKDTAAAEKDLNAAIALKRDYTAATFLLSQLEIRDGNVKEALATALAAAYFAPNDPNTLFQIGVLYAAQDDLSNAAAALSAAVAANPQFANARYLLAAVYAKRGDTASALTQMQAIADISTDNANSVAGQLTALEAGKDPFPANLLSAATLLKQ